MKKTVSIILSLVLCFGLFAGCTKTPNPTSAPQPTAGIVDQTPAPAGAEYYEELSMYIIDKVALIDPFNPGSQSSAAGLYGHMLYDTLVYYTNDNKYEPSLATEWTSADSQTFNFKLREGVKFHNGETFTSDDVAFTIDSAKNAPGTYIYDRFNQVDTYEVVSDYEINITLKSANVDFIFDIASPVVGIVNREAYAADSEKGPWVGTGPFYMEKFVSSDSIHLAAFDDYWGEKPLTKKFVMRNIAEATARLIMLENDEFTFCDIDSVYIPQYQNDSRFVINSYVMDNCNFISFNMKKPITGDKNFRLAVAYAIDRQAMLDIALDGYGEVVDSGSFWGNNTAYKNRDLPLIEQDLEKAREYLENSGYNGETIKLTAAFPHTIKTSQVLMAQLDAIGIKCEVNSLDMPSYSAQTAYDNDCDIIVSSGAWSPLASSCRSALTPGSNSNKPNYENPEVLELIEQAAATPDGDERQELYYKIQELVYEDMPYLGTFHMALYIGAQKGTGGVKYYPTNYHDYSGAYRIKEAK